MKLIILLRFQLLFFSLCSFLTLFGQIPTGYYSSAEGLTKNELKEELNNIIDGHIEFRSTSSAVDVWDILKDIDRDTIDTSKVVLLYTGWTVNAEQEYNFGSGWTREHVWAKSRGDFGTSKGAGTDVHALRPCNVSVNTARNNRWFSYGDYEYIHSDGPTGCYTSSTSWVWEPRDKVKGDVARMIFYMATRYEGKNGELDLEVIDSIPSNMYTNEPVHAKLSVLMQWHIEDPVDDWERRRNDIIFYKYQKNRNPFIDHPEFANEIWGHVTSVDKNIKKNENVKLIKVVDFLGRETAIKQGLIQFYIYSDGSVQKRVGTTELE